MSKKSEYLSRYEELNVIGRGNFGSATLVRNKSDNNIYVAKKVILGSLNQKEVENAHLEVTLLKELRHPHVVEYIDNFIEDGVLIIIMEYCEGNIQIKIQLIEGDLGFFIKKRAQKGEYLDEKLILNWFLQILLALEFIHRKKILHRDIKSSNIFLRSNGTVKLGDFGISKILQHTVEAAMTVVGTPYYMSPEVCENKPFTFKSDVWALGCVLYEMCMLKHAFLAENLLGLVFKIVRDNYEPIPSLYSPELHMLVQKLLTKNMIDRPSIRDIFMEPMIQKTIEEFIRSDGNFTTMIKIPIKKTALHNEIKKFKEEKVEPVETVDDNSLTMGGTVMSMEATHDNKKHVGSENETPLQKMLKRKEDQRKVEEEKMRNAAKQNYINNSQTKDKKTRDLVGNANITGSNDQNRPSTSKNLSENFNQIQYQEFGFSNDQMLTQQSQAINPKDLNNQQNQGNYFYVPIDQSKVMPNQSQFGYTQISQGSAFNMTRDNRMNQNMNQINTQNDYLENTVGSLNFSMTEGSLASTVYEESTDLMYKVEMQRKNSGKSNQNPEYTAKVNTNVVTKNNPNDDRPLPTSLSTQKVNNIPKYTPPILKNEKVEKDDDYEEEYEDDFEEYGDDFEEYTSDEDDDNSRLTNKANDKDLSVIVDLYKEKLNYKKKDSFSGEETKEDSNDDTNDTNLSRTPSTEKKSQNNPKKLQIDQMKIKARQCLGDQLFEKAYKYLKGVNLASNSDAKIKKELSDIVGKKNLVHCFMLDQIIFLETVNGL